VTSCGGSRVVRYIAYVGGVFDVVDVVAAPALPPPVAGSLIAQAEADGRQLAITYGRQRQTRVS
jgi:hypothetical protein